MKKYKLLILIGLLVFISGCKANYNVNIYSNGKVEEQLIMTFDSNEVDSHDPGALIDDTIRTYKKNNMYVYYNIKKNISGNNSTITATRKYSSIDDYINNSELLPILFEKTLYINDYGIKGLQTSGEFYYDAIFDKSVAEESLFDDIDINVHSQFELLENNALDVDKSSNTLHWNINNQNKTFSMNFKFNNSKRYDIIIKDYLKENWISLVVVAAIVLVVIIVINFIKKQDKLNNKI